MNIRYAAKALVIGILMVVLLIPLGLINATIKERGNYRQEAVAKIAESYAGPQVISGPVLVVPYVETRREQGLDNFGKSVELVKREPGHWLFFPKTLSMEGQVLPSERRLGLHRVRVYELRSSLQAGFDAQLPPDPGGVREIGVPYLSISIADVRGLVGTPSLERGWRGGEAAAGQWRPPRGPRPARDARHRAACRRAPAPQPALRQHARRHRVAAGGADRRQQPHRAGFQLAAPTVQRPLPAARTSHRRRRLPAPPGIFPRWLPPRRRSTPAAPRRRRSKRCNSAWWIRSTCTCRPTAPASTASCSCCSPSSAS
jgi:hypothetical protein